VVAARASAVEIGVEVSRFALSSSAAAQQAWGATYLLWSMSLWKAGCPSTEEGLATTWDKID
jgi:hypothetical protein